MILLKRAALILLLVFASAKTWASTKAPDCSSGCLLNLVNHYLDAMTAHDASSLPFAAGLKATENGKKIQPGDGLLWKTAQAIVYRQTIVDPPAGQAVFFGVVKEAGGPALFVLRLAVAGGKITEAETMVARKGAHPIFNPDGLRTVKAVWTTPVPVEERLPRAELIKTANKYFDGIEKASADQIPFHPDCNRTENGVQTTNNDSNEFMQASCSAGIKAFTYIKKVRARRYPVVDEAHGIVLAIVQFDIPGNPASHAASGSLRSVLARSPRTLALYELFKIDDGRIREIQAFMRNEPLGYSSGW